MSQEHFQTELFHEIIQGIATSCESYLLEGKEMIDAAAKIYLAMQQKEVTKAVDETKLFTEVFEQKTFRYSRMATCKKCGYKFIRFVADGIEYCSGCGRKINND